MNIEDRKRDGPLLCELLGVKQAGNHNPCPACADKTAMSVFEKEGLWAFKCHKCDWKGDVVNAYARAKGLSDGEAFKSLVSEKPFTVSCAPPKAAATPAKPKQTYPNLEVLQGSFERYIQSKGWTLVATYDYGHLAVLRSEKPSPTPGEKNKKQFIQAHKTSDGWVYGGLDKNPLFRRHRVSDSKYVLVVEGEKSVLMAEKIGFVAVTSPGGSSGAGKADWSDLAGKIVIIWRDNDVPGIGYLNDVMSALEVLSPRPQIRLVEVEPLGLPESGDIVDLVARLELEGQTPDEIRAVVQGILDDATRTGGMAALEKELDDAISGKRFAVPFPWPSITRETRALLPGTVTVMCGSPGATKSLSILQCMRQWTENNLPCAGLLLEDGVSHALRRALAQITGNSNVTVDEWCKNNADELRRLQNMAEINLQRLADSMEALSESTRPTPDGLVDWVARKAEAGARVIVVDPITMMEKGARSWSDDEKFLFSAKRIVERCGASLLLVTHPRRQQQGFKGGPSMEDLAGGMVYSRFSQTLLYLQMIKPDSKTIKTQHGVIEQNCNRLIHVLKCRNSYGAGRHYGCWFDSATLCLTEYGQVDD